MNAHLIELFAQFGLAGIIFFGFLMTLKWVFDVNNKLLSDMTEERKQVLIVRERFVEQMKELSTANREFHTLVNDAHKYQREEHQQMIISLGRINGFKD